MPQITAQPNGAASVVLTTAKPEKAVTHQYHLHQHYITLHYSIRSIDTTKPSISLSFLLLLVLDDLPDAPPPLPPLLISSLYCLCHSSLRRGIDLSLLSSILSGNSSLNYSILHLSLWTLMLIAMIQCYRILGSFCRFHAI